MNLISQSVHSLIPGIKRRKRKALALLLLPLPFTISTAFEVQKSANQAFAALGYGLMGLMFVWLGVQVMYVGDAVEGDGPDASKGIKRFLWHLPGNLVIAIVLEFAGLVPMFVGGFAQNEGIASNWTVSAIKGAMHLPLFFLSFELWFRYFRGFLGGNLSVPVTRAKLFSRHQPLLLAMLVAYCIGGLFPESGPGLVVGTSIDVVLTILLWEILSLNFHGR